MSGSVIINKVKYLDNLGVKDRDSRPNECDDWLQFLVTDGVSSNSTIAMSIVSCIPVKCVRMIDATHEHFLANLTVFVEMEVKKKRSTTTAAAATATQDKEKERTKEKEKPFVIIDLTDFPFITTHLDLRDQIKVNTAHPDAKQDDFSIAVMKAYQNYDFDKIPIILVNLNIPFTAFKFVNKANLGQMIKVEDALANPSTNAKIYSSYTQNKK